MQTNSNRLSLPAQRIQALEDSPTLGMAKRAKSLAENGSKVIMLSLGEPDFKTPEHICEAAKRAIDEGFHGYSPVAGYHDLRMAIIDKFRRENNIHWKLENVIVSNGAKHSLSNVIQVLINPGDEVIIFSPYWVSYSEMVKLAEGKAVIVEGAFNNDFKVTAEQLESAINERTKVVMFASPNNPTGAVYSKADLEAIADVVRRYPNVYVLADEIYEYINFSVEGHFSIGSVPEIADRVITVNGVAKGFAMTGWRIGYLGAVKWIVDGVEKLQGQQTSAANSIAQKAAVAALNGPLDCSISMREEYRRRRDVVMKLLTNIPYFLTNVPAGAFYAFPDVSYYFGKSDGKATIYNSDDFAEWLLNETHVAVVAGSGFGAPHCIRISTAAAEQELTEAIKRIENAVMLLK